MKTFLPFIVVGLTAGSVYALAGLGLVLTYKTSGIFNFAHGVLATTAAYLYYELKIRHGLPWPVAAILAVGVAGLVFGLLLERMAFVLAAARPAMKIVATVGMLVSIQALAVLRYGGTTRTLPAFLPTGTFRVFGTNVGYDQAIVVIICAALLVALTLLFRVTRLGVAMRSVVDSPDLLNLTGISPARVRRASWLIGSTFAALSGVLFAPFFGLNAALLTLLVVQAFGAAALGRFSSLPLTYVGGLGIGVLAELSKKYVSDVPSLQGIPPSLPFIVLFVVLVITPKGRLRELGSGTRRLPAARRAIPLRLRVAGLAVTGLGLVLVPHVVGVRRITYAEGLAFALLFLSLALVLRTSGQVSLCHTGFAAVGAATFANVAHGTGVPWLVAVFVAGLAAVPAGALIAIPAIRLSGIYLALATFGFGILLERLGYTTSFMFGHGDTRPAPRPHLGALHLDTDTGYYYVCLVALASGVGFVMVVERSRLGRLLRGIADSPQALTTSGANINMTKVIVFSLSAFMAATSGALLAGLYQNASGSTYPSFNALVLLAVLAVNAAFTPSTVISCLASAAFFVVVPSYLDSPNVGLYVQVGFGLAAIAAAMAETGQLSLRRGAPSAPTETWSPRSRLRASPVAARTVAARAAHLSRSL